MFGEMLLLYVTVGFTLYRVVCENINGLECWLDLVQTKGKKAFIVISQLDFLTKATKGLINFPPNIYE